MELTFVTTNPGSRTALKRSQACESCRKRKKRCNHTHQNYTESDPAVQAAGPTQSDPNFTSKNPSSLNARSIPADQHVSPQATRLDAETAFGISSAPESGRRSGNHASLPNAHKSPLWRFVGDLNPEAVFHRESESTTSPGQDKVGVWQSHPEQSGLSTTINTPNAPQNRIGRLISNRDSHLGFHERVASGRQNVDYTLTIPQEDDQAALINIYFERINSTLPIIDETDFREALKSGSASILLIQAICLAAAKDHQAKNHLRLMSSYGTAFRRVSTSLTLLSVREFSQALAEALDSGFQSRIEKNKLTLIRALALSSLHVDGPDGTEESSMRLIQAIHHAQTIALHLDTATSELEDESLRNLFWSLWSLDRLNACMNGRPIIMNNIDIGIKIRNPPGVNYSASFGILLRIADMVDPIIEFYRPSTDDLSTGLETEFPGFEEIARDCAALQLSPDTLRTLELFYHSVAILSSRSHSFKTAPKSTPSTVRQALSALCIVNIMEEQDMMNLLPLPVVPYSLSLALSVAYKHLRQTGLATNRVQAKRQLERCCSLLDRLGKVWWSAAAMAKLGRRALNEANKGMTRSNSERALEELARTGSTNDIGTQQAPGFQGNPSIIEHDEYNGRTHEIRSEIILPENSGVLTGIGALPENPVGAFIQDDFNSTLGFDDIFDAAFGNYLDLNLPTNFGDPLFIDDLNLSD